MTGFTSLRTLFLFAVLVIILCLLCAKFFIDKLSHSVHLQGCIFFGEFYFHHKDWLTYLVGIISAFSFHREILIMLLSTFPWTLCQLKGRRTFSSTCCDYSLLIVMAFIILWETSLIWILPLELMLWLLLRDLVPFMQFKKHEKHPWRSVTFSKVASFSLQFS